MSKADKNSRAAIGIAGLDKMIAGGIPGGDLVLVSGTPGAGKTILALKFICSGAEANEPGVFVSFDSEADEILAQSRSLRLGLEELVENKKAVLARVDSTDIYKALDDIEKKVKEIGAKRLVIDSISVLSVYASSYRNLPEDLITFLQETKHAPPILMGEVTQKQMVYHIISRIRRLGCTTIITSELSKNSDWFSRDTVSEFACDGIILLDQHALGEENIRTLQVVKMRRTEHAEGVHQFAFKSGDGITVK